LNSRQARLGGLNRVSEITGNVSVSISPSNVRLTCHPSLRTESEQPLLYSVVEILPSSALCTHSVHHLWRRRSSLHCASPTYLLRCTSHSGSETSKTSIYVILQKCIQTNQFSLSLSLKIGPLASLPISPNPNPSRIRIANKSHNSPTGTWQSRKKTVISTHFSHGST
jgi:hypothetical protein